jgi:hypothetical protein
MSEELYPHHKIQAIEEFTSERLQSYFLKTPNILQPALHALEQSFKLLNDQHYSAALVFAASAIEIFLKNALLRPVIFGQINNGMLALSIVDSALSQTGFKKYDDLICKIYQEIIGQPLDLVLVGNSNQTLLNAAVKTQELRNKCLHKGELVSEKQAKFAVLIAKLIFQKIVVKVISKLGIMLQGDLMIAPSTEINLIIDS